MKEQSYRAIAEAVNSSPFMKSYIIWFNRIVTLVIYLLYPALLVLLLLQRDHIPLKEGFLPALIIPGVSFLVLSFVRDRINAPRPYEVFKIPSVINKKTAGHSFPSRHIFSMFIIAVTVFYFYPIAGILIGLTGAALAMNRVLGGVHFIKDVLAGAASGVVCGIIGFYLILPLII